MKKGRDENFIEPSISLNSEETDPFASGNYELHSMSAPQLEMYDQPIEMNESFENNGLPAVDTSTEAFPEFNPSIDEELPFQPDQGTTKDEAEFGPTSSNINIGPNTNGPFAKPEQPRGAPDLNKTALPRRQRGNSNDRSRMRAEEICHDNFNFVCHSRIISTR